MEYLGEERGTGTLEGSGLGKIERGLSDCEGVPPTVHSELGIMVSTSTLLHKSNRQDLSLQEAKERR